MDDNRSPGISYTAAFFMLIAFVITALMVVGEITAPLWTAMTGKTVTILRDGPWSPEDSTAMRTVQVITVLLGFFLPAVVTARIISRRPLALLGFSRGARLQQAGLIVLIMGTALLISTSFSYFNSQIPVPGSWKIWFDKMELEYNQQVEVIVNLKSGSDYLFALVVMAFLPALCEETLFRGGLQNFLSRATGKPWLSIVIISILFSLAHISFYGFLSRLFLGIILGALFHYSGKLWLSILAHFINNAVALTVLYVYIQQGKSLQEAMKTDMATWWGILALPVIIGLFILFKKYSVNRNPV